MADYHTVYKEPEGTTTEWEDLQVKFGNKEAKPKPQIEAWKPREDGDGKGKGKDYLDTRTEEELEELEDDLEDDKFMEDYRQRRLAELKAAAVRPRFGTVELIKGADFVREVTNASRDFWVVLHLFQDGIAACGVMQQCLADLAAKFPGTKFVRAIATDIIPNYPNAHLPTLLVYSGGQLKETLTGMASLGVGKGRKCTPEDVALALCRIGPVLMSPGESEESAMERVRRNVVSGLVERHIAAARDKDGSDDDDY